MKTKSTQKIVYIIVSSLSLVVALVFVAPLIPVYSEIAEIDVNSGNIRKTTVCYGFILKKVTNETAFAILLSKYSFETKPPKWERIYMTRHFILGKEYVCYYAGDVLPKLNLLAKLMKDKNQNEKQSILAKTSLLLANKQYEALAEYVNRM